VEVGKNPGVGRVADADLVGTRTFRDCGYDAHTDDQPGYTDSTYPISLNDGLEDLDDLFATSGQATERMYRSRRFKRQHVPDVPTEYWHPMTGYKAMGAQVIA
jgi:hypothetical protein